jgi:hypothetical protein
VETANKYPAWQDPWLAALANPLLLVDAHMGHGGKYFLGKWLARQIRGTSDPYAAIAMPRGAYDDPDPSWLSDPSWDKCFGGASSTMKCNWTGENWASATLVNPPGMAAKIAWVNGDDVSMNDIVPRMLKGRANFRIFGPHASHGAYGEISRLPPVTSAWTAGSMQVLDTRFGATFADAHAAAWESGVGVAPDQVVVQKLSDLLNDKDTLLSAAQTWLLQ